MEKEKFTDKEKSLCVDDLRHAEYYGMQSIFDELYARSEKGEVFTSLMDIILSRENILLAYRNIKTNEGSSTPGTDNLTIADIKRLTPDEFVSKVKFIVQGSKHGYRPKPVRRKEIPKLNGGTRPLGIPCIWDRIIQQCIKQVMEPICEARFSEHSYGFRPNRSVENALADIYKKIQLSNLHYVIEFDIKGFFDNVNHPKLIRQLWAMGFRDKRLIYVIKQILKAPIKMPDGSTFIPDKGTPQGGIISPLLANVVLNELDHWVESNWENFPIAKKSNGRIHKNGTHDRGYGYRVQRATRLKEIYIVRYADDFRIICRTKNDALKTKIAITQWLLERLKLEVSPEKTRIVNIKKKYSDFLGFKIKVHKKGKKYVVRSRVSDKQLKQKSDSLVQQAKRIAFPRPEKGECGEIYLYNSMVLGYQNYYCYATHVYTDFQKLHRRVMAVLTSRLKRRHKLSKYGRPLSKLEKKRYGKTKTIRFISGPEEPVYPIGYVKHHHPLHKRKAICSFTPEGREAIHTNLRINTGLMLKMMRTPSINRSVEYLDNRISLFSEQWGKCAVTGIDFVNVSDIHCHHKTPVSKGGDDSYSNLILVLEPVHILIHATNEETINKYLSILNLGKKQLNKLNSLREMAGNLPINQLL